MAKKSAVGARLAPAEVPAVKPLSLAELRRAAPVRATAPVPEGVFGTDRTRLYAVSRTTPALEVSRPRREQATVWQVESGADTLLTPHWPGHHLEAVTRDATTPWARTGSRAYRPRWTDLEYLPRLLPYRRELERLQSIGPRLSPLGKRTWISVGYPSQASGVPQVDFDIDIKDIDGDGDGLELETLYAKAFGGGWSGGPLWGMLGEDPYVIGIKSGWEVDGYDPARGVFAGGRHLVDLAIHGHANWPP